MTRRRVYAKSCIWQVYLMTPITNQNILPKMQVPATWYTEKKIISFTMENLAIWRSRCNRIIRIFTFLRQFLDCYFCILCAQLYCWALQNVRKVRSLLLSNFHVVRQFFVSHVPNICTQFQVFLDSWILYQICKKQESFFCYGKSDIMFKM